MLGQIKRPLNFFKRHYEEMPKLARVARIILSVPSTVPSESVLSIAGIIQNDIRNRLSTNYFKYDKFFKIQFLIFYLLIEITTF